jgi:hypothetical protein
MGPPTLELMTGNLNETKNVEGLIEAEKVAM